MGRFGTGRVTGVSLRFEVAASSEVAAGGSDVLSRGSTLAASLTESSDGSFSSVESFATASVEFVPASATVDSETSCRVATSGEGLAHSRRRVVRQSMGRRGPRSSTAWLQPILSASGDRAVREHSRSAQLDLVRPALAEPDLPKAR